MLFYSTIRVQYSAPWVQQEVYNGPDDFHCIAEVLLERYLNNPLVQKPTLVDANKKINVILIS